MEAEQIDMATPETPTTEKRVQITDLLCTRYPEKTHILLFEVRDAAGFGASRSCDAIAISTWPSRGLDLMGFEIKESRADWLREYRNPDKAETFQAMCDRWYLVVGQGDGKVVQMDELPDTWGLLVRRGNRLVCEKEAPKRTSPSIVDRSFLAALLKNTRDAAAAPVRTAFDRGFLAGKEAMKPGIARNEESRGRELRELRESVKAFETASGVHIGSYNGQKIGDAVRLVMDGGHRRDMWRIDNMLNNARDVLANLEALKASATLSERADGDSST